MPEGAAPSEVGFDASLDGLQFSSSHGHGAGFFLEQTPDFAADGAVAEYVKASHETSVERIGEFRATSVRGHNTVFPNFSYLIGTNTLRVWHPRGPGALEVWSWTLVDADAPTDVKAGWREGAIRTFSPAGIFEQDDGENWTEMQKVPARPHRPANAAQHVDGRRPCGHPRRRPGTVNDVFSEEAARGFYRYWARLMERA